VSPQWSVYGGVNGQYANKNLDGSQKMLMGGPYTVRAYDAGTGAVAQATVLTGEVRWKTGLPHTDHQLTVAAFYDQGWGRQMSDNSSPTGGLLVKDNAVNLAGAGLYAKLTRAKDYALGLTWAHRTGQADPVAENGSKDRLWLTAGKSF
jgi:hemolysin activation/secretion protein